MSESDSDNPYQPPESDQPPASGRPPIRDLVISTVVALLVGVPVFLGTCIGSGIFAFEFAYGSRDGEWLFLIVWIGSGALAIFTAWRVGRMVYVRRKLGPKAKESA